MKVGLWLTIYIYIYIYSPVLVGLKIYWLHPLQWSTTSYAKEHPGYDTKLYLVMRFQFRNSGSVEYPFFIAIIFRSTLTQTCQGLIFKIISIRKECYIQTNDYY